jgi:hypothetical protein
MLEVLFLIYFVRKLSAMAKSKGRSGGWGGLGVAFWVGGEFLGFIAGSIADAGMGAYLLALVCAGIGALVAYFIVRSLGPSEMMAEARYDAAMPVHAPAGPYDLSNPYTPPRS